MKQGSVFRRCSSCGARKDTDKACQCGHKTHSWAFIVDVGGPGQRKQRRRGGFATKADALAAMNELQSDVAKGTVVEPSRQTVAEFLEGEWLPWLASQVRPSTVRMYQLHCRRYLIPRVGDERLQTLTASQLNGVYGWEASELGLSASTIRKTHATIHRALRDAAKWGRVQRNVADQADAPTGESPEMQTWTREQLGGFLAYVAADRLYALWRLLAMTGLRRGEALGLRWRDVDLDAGTLQVRQTLTEDGKAVRFGEPKTRRGKRQVALDAATVDALRDWFGIQTLDRAAWDEAWTDTGLVFTREDGTAVRPSQATREFDRHVKAAGLPRIRLHDLRHTHATLALQAGVHPKVVSERLGHASIAITLDTYSHAVPAMQAEAAEQIAGIVSRRKEEPVTD